MTSETSRNPGYAPFAQWSAQQAPVPQAVHNLPATIAASGNVNTSLIKTDGYTLISAGVTLTQNGTMSIQRYLDDGGTQTQGAAISVPVVAGIASNLDVLDGKPFASFVLTVTNGAASVATISGFALLLQTSAANPVDTAVDGSSTITVGGTAQNLFGGAVPANGFFIANPDAINDVWIALGTTAISNGQGSIRVAANGGYYASEASMKPWQAISVVGAVTGQKFTAARW
jgi:hypothetical protein